MNLAKYKALKLTAVCHTERFLSGKQNPESFPLIFILALVHCGIGISLISLRFSFLMSEIGIVIPRRLLTYSEMRAKLP